MKITIENTSSPGASFTDNTNDVLVRTYGWIQKNAGKRCSYHDFRMAIQRDEGINDNNNRNIHPLLKNCGFASYETRGDIEVDHFFTRTGLAYIKTLETLMKIEKSVDYSAVQKKNAIARIEKILQEIVYNGLLVLFKNNQLNYIEPLKDFLRFTLYFRKISKVEFAYFLYVKKQNGGVADLEIMKDTIESYRDGTIDFEVDVTVRNDIDLREKSRSDHRKEGLSYLTSYTYFSSLLLQAGVLKKDRDYFVIIDSMREKSVSLLEVE